MSGAGAASIWPAIGRDVSLLAAGNVAVVVAQLGFRSILLVALLPSDYGRLSLVLSIYNTAWIIGATGLPNSVARHIAIADAGDDSQIVRSGVRAAVWPTVVAGAIVAGAAGTILHSPLAALLAAIGLASLVYALLTMGILRGRGKMGPAATVMPVGSLGEVIPLVLLFLSGSTITPLSAFACFCAGNVVGVAAGTVWVSFTKPARIRGVRLSDEVPGPRDLLGISMWLGIATASMTLLPLVLRSAAALDSYTTVAMVDVALVLFTIPQRLGAVIVFAVTPHASRALRTGRVALTVSLRENLLLAAVFALIAALVAFTPVVTWIFDGLGRHVYAGSNTYLALALLAGPARVLYGVVEGVLIARNEGRFLAITALVVSCIASVLIYAAAALRSPALAFGVFSASVWATYLLGNTRMRRLNASCDSSSSRLPLYASAPSGGT